MKNKMGNVFKYRRQLLDLSVQELSKKTGISKSSIYYYERGDNIPNTQHFIKMCKVLGLGIYDF